MGSTIGLLLADVITNHVIGKTIKTTPLDHESKFICCSAADCFAPFANTSSINIFLRNLNCVHN